MTKIATALQRDAKKNSEPRFRAGETQILTSGVPFSVALRSKKRGGQKKAPRSKRLYPYRKNPSVRHTVWGKSQASVDKVRGSTSTGGGEQEVGGENDEPIHKTLH